MVGNLYLAGLITDYNNDNNVYFTLVFYLALQKYARSEGVGFPRKAYENMKGGSIQRAYVRPCNFQR